MNGAELPARCPVSEDVKYIYSIPGEENIVVMGELLESSIKFTTTRHKHGAPPSWQVYREAYGQSRCLPCDTCPGAATLINSWVI